MSKIANYEEVIEKLKDKFVPYLEEHGFNTKTNFVCLDPEHQEEHASMGVVPQSGMRKAHCFSCGTFCDIFDAVHWLEGKPKNGPLFIEQTVMYLAEKYGIQVDLKELTEEERYRIETFNAYRAAATYISCHATDIAIKDMERRGWNPKGCKERLIGAVDNFKNYKDYMKKEGYSVSFLDDVELLNEKMFHENNLIFTICDEHGRPCGFSARNLTWEKGAAFPKYINSSAKCRIYEKSKRLYNIHNTRNKTGTTYITEGCADTEAMIQHGLPTTVCVGGTAFTDYHVIELQKLNKNNLTLVMDGDEAGIKSANKIIAKFAGKSDFALHIVVIPDGQDPDDFLREKGKEAFEKLKRWTAFEWKLNSYDDRIETQLIRSEIIPIISGEGSAIEREKMIKLLSEKIDISEEAINDEVKEAVNDTERKIKRKRDNLLNELVLNLKTTPGDWSHLMNEARINLDAATRRFTEDMFSPLSLIKQLEVLKEKEMNPEDAGMTFNFKGMREFNEAVSGNHEATLNVIGGVANTGKTAMMSGLALELASNYDEDNFVVFHTIDDTVDQFCGRLVCQLAKKKYAGISLNKIKNPNKYHDVQKILLAREYAYEMLFKLINDKRLLIKGGEEHPNAGTLSYAEEMIKYAQKARKGARVIYFLDNFHRLRDFQGGGGADERNRFKRLSNAAKDLAKRYKIPVWATMEYNKSVGTAKPTNNSISESVAMEYDANLIVHLYNDWHSAIQEGREPDVFFNRPDGEGRQVKSPRIEAIIGKNKLNSFKGSLWFDFYADQSLMHPVSTAIVQKEMELAKAANGSN